MILFFDSSMGIFRFKSPRMMILIVCSLRSDRKKIVFFFLFCSSGSNCSMMVFYCFSLFKGIREPVRNDAVLPLYCIALFFHERPNNDVVLLFPCSSMSARKMILFFCCCLVLPRATKILSRSSVALFFHKRPKNHVVLLLPFSSMSDQKIILFFCSLFFQE